MTPADAQALRLFGTREPAASPRMLTAGDLSCELADGALRYVRWRGVEVVRGISYLLRDADWGTAPMHVHGCEVRETAKGFEVDLSATLGEGHSAVDVQGVVKGGADGTLDFRVSAHAQQSVETSRCGFVLLHPADVAGKGLQVIHTDGSKEDTSFPLLVSPVQPVLSIRQLRHAPEPGMWVDCLLEAELPHDPDGKFEMEDQRNWTDASFKTYVASLLDPWPYTLEAGRTYVQRIRLQVEDTRAHRVAAATAARTDQGIRIGEPLGHAVPAIGVAVPTGSGAMSEYEMQALRVLRPQWLLGEIGPLTGDAAAKVATERRLMEIFALASSVGAKVQLDVICGSAQSPEEAACAMKLACAAIGASPHALRALPEPLLKSFQPQGDWPETLPLESYARAFGEAFDGADIGGGMFTNFTELNRKRPAAEALAFIGHSVCPIVHAADDRSVMETLQSLAHIATSVHSHWPGLRYRLGPATLAMHRNPYGEAPTHNARRSRVVMGDDDPRHQAAFGASWIAGLEASVAPLGVDVLYLNCTHGSSGPLLRPDLPGGDAGACVPAWSVQEVLARAAGAPLLELLGLPGGVLGMAWNSAGGGLHALIANVHAQGCEISAPGFTAHELSNPMILAGATREAVCANSLQIGPYECWILRCDAAR